MKHSADTRSAGLALVASGLSYSEAARQLGVHVSTLWGWCHIERRARRQEARPFLSPLAPEQTIAGVVIVSALGRLVSPGVYARRSIRTKSQLDRTHYRVCCAVCGRRMAPVSHARLMKLADESDVVNCVYCWRRT